MGDEDKIDWFGELCKKSDKTEEELEQLCEEKIEQYEGMVTEEGAPLIVGRELGLELTDTKKQEIKTLDISNIVTGMRDVLVEAKIKRKSGINRYDGGKVANWVVSDDTGETQITFWNRDVEEKYPKFSTGDKVTIKGGYTKDEISDWQSSNYGVPAVHIGDEAEIEEKETEWQAVD